MQHSPTQCQPSGPVSIFGDGCPRCEAWDVATDQSVLELATQVTFAHMQQAVSWTVGSQSVQGSACMIFGTSNDDEYPITFGKQIKHSIPKIRQSLHFGREQIVVCEASKNLPSVHGPFIDAVGDHPFALPVPQVGILRASQSGKSAMQQFKQDRCGCVGESEQPEWVDPGHALGNAELTVLPKAFELSHDFLIGHAGFSLNPPLIVNGKIFP